MERRRAEPKVSTRWALPFRSALGEVRTAFVFGLGHRRATRKRRLRSALLRGRGSRPRNSARVRTFGACEWISAPHSLLHTLRGSAAQSCARHFRQATVQLARAPLAHARCAVL
eukprot:2187269-Pleurochrysis_carterae.AAC.1